MCSPHVSATLILNRNKTILWVCCWISSGSLVFLEDPGKEVEAKLLCLASLCLLGLEFMWPVALLERHLVTLFYLRRGRQARSAVSQSLLFWGTAQVNIHQQLCNQTVAGVYCETWKWVMQSSYLTIAFSHKHSLDSVENDGANRAEGA